MLEILAAMVSKVQETIRPEQVCWVCLLVTFGGMAWANRTFADADDVRTIRVEQLEQRAFDLRGQQCQAIRNGAAPAAYTTMLQQVLRSYKEITESDYRLPDCSELTL